MQHSSAVAETNGHAGLPISSYAPNNFICEIEEISSKSLEIPVRRPAVVSGGAHGGTSVVSSSNGGSDDDVYVAVGKGNSSMDALSWALKHVWKPSSFVYLIHVFPEVHQIPTPMGMLPKNQVSAQQVETHMSRERSKRRELLTKFLNLCSSSKVQVDTVLIESDLIVKAILDLIPVLNIRRLIVGASKSNLRLLKRGKGKAEHIQKGAPHYCDVNIICEGKEVAVNTDLRGLSSSPPTPKNSKNKEGLQRDQDKHFLSCTCFSKKLL